MIPEPRSAPPTPAPSRRGTPRGGLTVRPLIIFLILLFVASALVSAPTWAATIPPPPPPISSGNHLPRAASNPVAPEPPRSPEALPSEPVVSRGTLVAPAVPVYDPGAGLFLQLDPSGYADSPNLYAGFANDPINRRDPTGRVAPLVIAIGAVAVVDVALYAYIFGDEELKDAVSNKVSTLEYWAGCGLGLARAPLGPFGPDESPYESKSWENVGYYECGLASTLATAAVAPVEIATAPLPEIPPGPLGPTLLPATGRAVPGASIPAAPPLTSAAPLVGATNIFSEGEGSGGSKSDGGAGVKLTRGGRKTIGDLEGLKDTTVADAVRQRGGGGSQVNKIPIDLRQAKVGEVANRAAAGDEAAKTTLKIIKQAKRLGQKY